MENSGASTSALHAHPSTLGLLDESPDPYAELLRTYVHQHGVAVMLGDDAAASHSFVVGYYSCPHQLRRWPERFFPNHVRHIDPVCRLGNRLHDFLNAFAGAVVTNRTLLWRYCSATGRHSPCPGAAGVGECEQALRRRPWIPAAADLLPRLAPGATLALPIYPARLRHPPSFLRRIPGYLEAHPSADQLACCGIDAVASRVVSFGVVEAQEMAALHGAVQGTKPVLGDAARLRAAQLFGQGAAVAYGALFEAAFRPTCVDRGSNALPIPFAASRGDQSDPALCVAAQGAAARASARCAREPLAQPRRPWRQLHGRCAPSPHKEVGRWRAQRAAR